MAVVHLSRAVGGVGIPQESRLREKQGARITEGTWCAVPLQLWGGGEDEIHAQEPGVSLI